MSETLRLLEEVAERLFADRVTPESVNALEEGVFDAALWRAIEEAGFARALLREEQGGAGAGFAAAFPLMRACGLHAAPVPLAESLLAAWLLSEARLEIPAGVITLAEGDKLVLSREKKTVKLSGTLEAVPFARHAGHVVVGMPDRGKLAVALVALAGSEIEAGANLAGEPRDRVRLRKTPALGLARTSLPSEAVRLYGALMRAGQMAGALERALALSLRYAGERQQFGRAIAKFQAVQHALAMLAEEWAAASQAARAAFEAAGTRAAFAAIAAAKIRAGVAAEKGASLAHQVHGALGFTRAHPLHLATRRLWAWRGEFGAERDWALLLGRQAARQGAQGLWPFLTLTAFS